jgi:hypothetical protein
LREAVGEAYPLKSTHKGAYGLAACIFFLTYLMFEARSNLFLRKLASRNQSRAMFTAGCSPAALALAILLVAAWHSRTTTPLRAPERRVHRHL